MLGPDGSRGRLVRSLGLPLAALAFEDQDVSRNVAPCLC